VDAETTAMGGTVTHYKSELDAYKKQLATATGVRDIQGFSVMPEA
jgi:hypothetical protein